MDTLSSGTDKAWFVSVQLGSMEARFKIDTGAEVTAVSPDTYERVGKPPLHTPDKALLGPSRHPLQVQGQFQCDLTHQGRTSRQQVFVVKGLQNNLLGLPAITSLNLAARMDVTSTSDKGQESVNFMERFPKAFEGLGNLGEEYDIQLKPDAQPHALTTPRHVPLPLRQKVADELARMESMGIISKVEQPTPWCAGMVPVPKRSGAIRICVDLKPINQNVLREVHPLPRVDDTLAQLKGAKLFSKLDANSGFWQIPLSERSRLLTTFIAPSGRYCFNKLPFGISSAPEHFQKRMSRILEGLDGVLCQMDDVLIHGRDETEHNTRVIAALKRIEAAGVTLNRDKCEFGKPCLKFLGHVLDQDGIRADPEKTSAITQMRAPTTVTELRRFLGMANQLGKFTPRLAELTQPLRELLSKSNAWVWGPPQQQAFAAVKRELSTPMTLAFYDPDAPTKVSADASSYGVGAVLLQELDSHWKPVAYASRSMNDTERRYAQIEKEALAVTWACERFSTYILGKTFEIETDHKPLVPLLGAKHLNSLPPRILRFRLRMDRFSYSINHVSGKSLCTADALSRAPTSPPTQEDSTHAVLAELAMESQISHLPASPETLNRFQKGQHSDSLLTRVKTYCRNGWPDQAPTQRDLRLYWEARGQLTLHGDLLLYDGRVVVPETLRDETLRDETLHGGHQGIQRCRTRARSSVWWPGLSQQIGKFVKNCTVCAKNATPNKEPLMASPLPDYPWQKVGTDLFSLNGVDYLIVVDYFSRYPEVVKLTTVTSQSVIRALRSLFARHGIPEYVASDNGPQYSSQDFSDFAKTYGFSPMHRVLLGYAMAFCDIHVQFHLEP